MQSFFLILFFIPFHSFSQIPVITSHRGAAAFAPENTLLSVQKALDAGAARIEVDVRMSSDSILVIMHDRDLERTTNCEGKVFEMKYSEMADCNAGFDQKIPTLSEVLHVIDGKATLVIDLKSSGSLYEKMLLDEIKNHDATAWCMLSSFHADMLKRLHDADSTLSFHRSFVGKIPFLPIYFGTRIFIGNLEKAEFVSEFNFNHWFISRHLVKKIHRMNKKINAWTVNNSKRCRKLIRKGVDGIITDNPLIRSEE